MAQLSATMLLEVCKAAVEAGLASKRNTLLSSFEPGVRSGLEEDSTPNGQLLLDLNGLNVLELSDGTVPLLIWLKIAELLIKPRQVQVFQEAIRVCSENDASLTTVSSVESFLVDDGPIGWLQEFLGESMPVGEPSQPDSPPQKFKYTNLSETFLSGDFSAASDALARLDRAVPETVEIFEEAFRAIGLAVLLGENLTIPQNLLEGMWKHQEAMVFWRGDGLPFPCLSRHSGAERYSYSVWLIACLAISEVLQDTSCAMEPRLALWRAETMTQEQYMLLARISGAWTSEDEAPVWVPKMFELAGRLYKRHGTPPEGARTNTWQYPAWLVDQVRQGRQLTSREVSSLSDQASTIQALQNEAEAASVAWADVASSVWSACGKDYNHKSFLLPEGSGYEELWWPHIPLSLLKVQLLSGHARLPYHAFTAEHWAAFREVWIEQPRRFGRQSPIWQKIPEQDVVGMMLSGRLGTMYEVPWELLWDRFPLGLMDVVWEQMRNGHANEGINTALSFPREHAPSLVGRLASWVEKAPLGSELLDQIDSYLHYLSAHRYPGWKEAYALRLKLKDTKPHTSQATE